MVLADAVFMMCYDAKPVAQADSGLQGPQLQQSSAV
jgi:hypothetical protein